MRVNTLGSLIFTACVTVATGQSSDQQVDRVIYLTGIEKPQEINEVATVIRAVADIKSLSVDTSQRSLTVHATAEQIGVADSLAKELMAGQGSNSYEYKMSSGDLIHVYYLPHSESIRDFQWVATTIRSITDLRWAFTYNAGRAFVVRGTPAQMEMTEWLAQQFDQPDGRDGSNEYRVPVADEHRDRANDELLHVYIVKHVESEENLQELASLIRSVGTIRRLFTVGKPMAVAMRGTAEEMGLADWLLQELDQPASGPASAEQGLGEAAPEFQMPSGDAVRVF